MWFVFPQLRGLGRSATAQYYGIGSRGEAAYLQHPVLGARLRECVDLVLAVDGSTAHAIFGSPDDLKFRSSMTLFAAIAPSEPLFRRALDKYFGGEPDPATRKSSIEPRRAYPAAFNQGSRMSALIVDKGWLSGTSGSFVQLNSITGLRVAPSGSASAGFDVDALVQGNWVTVANFPDEKTATERATAVLRELKNLFRYGS